MMRSFLCFSSGVVTAGSGWLASGPAAVGTVAVDVGHLATAEGVAHELLGHAVRDLRRLAEQRLQLDGVAEVELLAVEAELAARVHRLAAVHGLVGADAVVILEREAQRI